MVESAVSLNGIEHWYGDHQALKGLSLDIEAGQIFGLLGPNGGGKTTLFRILSTLLPLQNGEALIHGLSVQNQPQAIRYRIGVTFQSPSLDLKLTVAENLLHQGHLYGLAGRDLKQRLAERLERLGLSDRARDKAESLSGGLKRRVEIAKGLLHDPDVLLLDEPSTGLDPGARHDLWQYLNQLRQERGVTIVVATHLMEEAEKCDSLAILDRGKIVASGSPDELRSSLGGDCVTIHTKNIELLKQQLLERFSLTAKHYGEALRVERENGHELLKELVEAFPEEIESISLGRPTLEDVFIDRTGHQFWDAAE